MTRRKTLQAIGAVATLTMTFAHSAVAQTHLDLFHTFTGGATDGAMPNAQLVRAADGDLYGTTSNGGSDDRGTVFRVTTTGNLTLLHAFSGGVDGDNPYAPVMQASDGNFYGTTVKGGTSGMGTVFRMTPSGAITILHAFSGYPSEGASPYAPLVQASDGRLYGTTYKGGSSNYGTVFRINTDGSGFTTLWSMRGATANEGANIYAGLTPATDGNLYGVTYAGGVPAGYGTIFRITTSGALTTLYVFTGGTDGANPIASMQQASDGYLYGTTHLGGSSNLGVIFRMNLSGAGVILHQFSGTDGAWPDASLFQGGDGNFYGATKIGGDTYTPSYTAFGTVFKMTPSGALTVLHSFTAGRDGANPSSLYRSTDGMLYGTTQSGGTSYDGVVFRLRNNAPVGDFDGGGQSDLTVFRPSNSTWYSLKSSTNYTQYSAVTFGMSTDTLVPADYDGDGRTDMAVFRPSNSTWYILQSTTGSVSSVTFGTSGDVPVPGDYDGDGRTDIAVFRPSNGSWYIWRSSDNGVTVSTFGLSTDKPIVADYDGDGRADIAVFRPSNTTWYILTSSSNFTHAIVQQYGLSTDIRVPMDYDGDGKADFAVFRPSTNTWYIWQSSNNAVDVRTFGASGDVVAPADYDGDGKTDLAVFRPSNATWYVWKSTGGAIVQQWGLSTDIPINKRQ